MKKRSETRIILEGSKLEMWMLIVGIIAIFGVSIFVVAYSIIYGLGML